MVSRHENLAGFPFPSVEEAMRLIFDVVEFIIPPTVAAVTVALVTAIILIV